MVDWTQSTDQLRKRKKAFDNRVAHVSYHDGWLVNWCFDSLTDRLSDGLSTPGSAVSVMNLMNPEPISLTFTYNQPTHS